MTSEEGPYRLASMTWRNHGTARCSPCRMRRSSFWWRERSSRSALEDAAGSTCLRNTSDGSCSSLKVRRARTSENARRSSMAPQNKHVDTASRSRVREERMRTTSRDSSSVLIRRSASAHTSSSISRTTSTLILE